MKTIAIRLLGILGALAMGAPLTAQTTWWVDASWSGCPGSGSQSDPFCSIQDALNAAGPGDLVLVLPGTYPEDLDGSDEILRSDADGDPSTLDADPGLVNLTGLVNLGYLQFEGFTAGTMESLGNGPGALRNCVVDQVVLEQASGQLEDCAVRTIEVDQAGYCSLLRCTVSNPSGDGIVAGGDTTVLVSRSTIHDCAAYGIRAPEFDADLCVDASVIAHCADGAVFGRGDFCRVEVLESTLADNGTPALDVEGESAGLRVIDSILWNDGGTEAHFGCDVFSFAEIRRAVVRGGMAALDIPCNDQAEIEQILDQDPRFVDASLRDYHLRPESPCINRGESSGEDLDGDARPFMGTGDLGADEYLGLHSLSANRFDIDHSIAEQVLFTIDGGAPRAGRDYLVFISISGTIPGLPIASGAIVPVNLDAVTFIALRFALHNDPSLQGFRGTLDGAGRAQPMLDTLAPFPPQSVGLSLSFGCAVASPWDFVTNPVSVLIR